MKCPNCYSHIAHAAVKCPRCDWSLKTPAPPTASAAFAESPIAHPWIAESDAAPPWAPASQLPLPSWEKSSLDPQPERISWEEDSSAQALGKNNWNPPAQQSASLASPLLVVPAPVAADQQGLPFSARAAVSTVPLTGGQKTLLLVQGCLPLGIAGVFGYFFSRFSGGAGNILDSLPWPFFFVFLVILAVIGYQAVQSFRDLASGTANVQVDRLQKTTRVRNKNSTMYYGEFAQLGKLRISYAAYKQSAAGTLYRITYSPATKRVWHMEKTE